MNFLQSILLGIIQGLTEFLPVSSSGHLVLFQHFLGLKESGDVAFEVFLHLGTLLAVLKSSTRSSPASAAAAP